MEMWKYLSLNKFNDTKVINMYNEVSDQVEVITVYFYQDGQIKLLNQNNEVVSPKNCYPVDDLKDFLQSARSNSIFGNRIRNALKLFNRNNKLNDLLQ